MDTRRGGNLTQAAQAAGRRQLALRVGGGFWAAGAVGGSCTSRLRLNATGSPIDHYRIKTVYIRGLSWPHDGSLNRGDALEVSRVDARRLLRPPPRAAFHPHGVLTPPRAGATAGRGRAAPHGPCHHNTFLSITATIAL